MPGIRRSPAQIARDRKIVGQLYLQGLSQTEIREELLLRFGEDAISQSTISRDLGKLNEEWLSELKQDLSIVKARENARMELLIKEHWAAWELDGNPAQLAGILRVIHFRSKFFRLLDHKVTDRPHPAAQLAESFRQIAESVKDPPKFAEQFRQWDLEAGIATNAKEQ